MPPTVDTGHSSVNPEFLKPSRSLGIAAITAVLAVVFLLAMAARAQAPAPQAQAQATQAQPQAQAQASQSQPVQAQSSVEAYAEAIKQSVIAQRITGMERYLALSSGGSLRVDALEFLIWDHMRLGHKAQSLQHARELLAIAPENPVAIAVVNVATLSQEPSANGGKREEQKRLATLKMAAEALQRLVRPEGMPERNFEAMRGQVAIMLNGATGMAYLRNEDYMNARPALQAAATNDPNNPQWVYGLGLALLNGKEKDNYRGYWYLARAANLSDSREIAEYARKRYRSGGGKEAEWQAFVASAAALDAPPAPAGESPATVVASSGVQPTLSAKNAERTGHPNVGGPPATAGQPAPSAASGKSKLETASMSKPSKGKTSFGFEDTLREPARTTSSPDRPTGPKSIAAPTDAVSLGILIETSLLTSHNRAAIISTLKEIVKSLRNRDEACILVFSDQLDFEQDLTADDKLLEEALAEMKPRSGKALLSGIAFAAGHLKRIGKNNNRVLLIISDGAGKAAAADTISFRSQVTGVRIDCIGLKADEADREVLARIAAYSGGKASFASNAEEFRTATLTMTRGMGIYVP